MNHLLLLSVLAIRTLEFRDPGTQELLLVGREETTQGKDSVTQKTEYSKPEDGQVVARESSEYNNETLQLITYSFADYQSGEESSLTSEPGKIKTRYRKNGKTDFEDSVLDVGAKPMGNASVPGLIERNIDKLKTGQAVEFNFYVPFKLTTFAFQIIRKGSGPDFAISVEPGNWLIRQFVKKAVFMLDEQSTQSKVKQFLGPSHIEIKGEANRNVIIAEKKSP